ncbi:hypothetical protein PYW08_000649 [Mythimna loreyi]|uniref:Uncharacterized protein n=1 Tax=Mythimna loreyi TaxID=667449 RepID=A0ACC2RD01_9NEOP|nr:hypothetical protein PYW08_000649 [Mythimna loreyi]
MSTSPASSSSSSELSDYDSTSSLEIVVNPKKLREELEKELEAERKAAAAKGGPTYNDGSALKIGDDGRVRSGRIVRLERIIRARKMMKAQVMKNMAKHLEKPHVRKAYDYFRRDIPPENDLCSNLTRKKVSISADENRLCVKIERRSPLPY